jgi:predicted site-specific integrase-resolvase
MNEQYISGHKITKQFDITSTCLRRWSDEGQIRSLRTQDGKGKRVYNLQDIQKQFGITVSDNVQKQTICYARVSSSHQKEDLERQVQVLVQNYPNAKLIKDIGSGVNFKRPGFNSLLQHIYDGNVETVVVAYKDRLCRFGFDLLEWFFIQTDTKLVVLNPICETETHDKLTRELADDLLTITNHFVAKYNGLRSSHNRRERKVKKEKEEEAKNENGC